jgi:nicotinate-nucleotide adenylyltransferase
VVDGLPQNPLKPVAGMASLPARLASARAMARHPRIRVSAIEKELGTQLTVDTIEGPEGALSAGSLHLADGGRQSGCNSTAGPPGGRFRTMVPIVVMARPHYAGRSQSAPAMGWLGGFRHKNPAGWRNWHLPAITW